MNERERVILGALLHDIGKFYMRSGRPADGYGREEWREEHGRAGAHARWSASFFSQYVPEQWREAGWLALTHHAPKDPLARIVQEADHLAASFDRTKRPADERGDIARDRLEALCEQIALPRQGGNSREAQRRFAHALRPLGLRHEAVFPEEFRREDNLQPRPPGEACGAFREGGVPLSWAGCGCAAWKGSRRGDCPEPPRHLSCRLLALRCL
jgi:hypothetical protein